MWIYIFSSPEPNPQRAFVIKFDHCPSSSLYTFHISIFFSRTTEPVSTKLGIKQPWMKGIQVYSNEGPSLSPRDNCEIKEMHWWHLKIFFSRTTGLTSTEFGAKHPLLKGIQICLNEGPWEIIRDLRNIHWWNFKKNHLMYRIIRIRDYVLCSTKN